MVQLPVEPPADDAERLADTYPGRIRSLDELRVALAQHSVNTWHRVWLTRRAAGAGTQEMAEICAHSNRAQQELEAAVKVARR